MNKSIQKNHIYTFLKSLPYGSVITSEVSSESMRPLFSKGDIVSIKITPIEHARLRDIIAFYVPSYEIVIHRIVQQTTSIDNMFTITTKGDSCLQNDLWTVNKSNFLGTVQPPKFPKLLFYWYKKSFF